MMRIGIITWHYFGNFGSALQAYALQKIILKLGYQVKIINYRNPKYSGGRVKLFLQYYIGIIVDFFHISFFKKYLFPFVRFGRENLNQTVCVRDKNKIGKLVKDIDVLICGSDQIWAPNVFDSVYMGDFEGCGGIKKISYAASIGLKYIPTELRQEYKRFLSDFSAVSVREEVGKQLLKRDIDICSTVVLDPTFLLNQSEYKSIQKKVPLKKTPYIFCYFLNCEHGYWETIKQLVERKEYNLIGISACEKDREWMEILDGIGPCEFLWLIDHAEIVLTDSYHGTIFSLLFHKCFWTFERFTSDDSICQNSRIHQLANVFGITDRIIHQGELINTNCTYDFCMFEQRLEKQRIKSINFLKGAL